MKIYVVLANEGYSDNPLMAFRSYQEAYEYTCKLCLQNSEVRNLYDEDLEDLEEDEDCEVPSFEDWVRDLFEDGEFYRIAEIILKE